MRQKKYLIRLLLVSTLALPLFFSACGGGGGGGGGGESSTTCSDVAGEWNIVENNYSPNCYNEPFYWVEYNVYTVTQDGCTLTVEDSSQNTSVGTINGDNVSLSGSFPEEGGTVTQTMNVILNGDSFTGTANWTWSDGVNTCNGQNELTGTRGEQSLISGVVRDIDTNTPIENAQVFFYGGGIGSTTTDSSGNYTFVLSQIDEFGGALWGDLYAGATGYFEAPSVLVDDLNTQPALPVIEDFTLIASGPLVTGYVHDSSSGLGIPNATVSFERDPMSTFRGGEITVEVQTDANGYYTIDASYFNESGLTSGFTINFMVNADGYLGATDSRNFTSYPITQDFNLLIP